MFKALINSLHRRRKPNSQKNGQALLLKNDLLPQATASVGSYDESVLTHSRARWEQADWGSLTKLELSTIQQHPDRAELALLSAAGHQQLGHHTRAKELVVIAMKWGCSKRLVSQILIAGVHNTLACVSALQKNQGKAIKHFQEALQPNQSSADPADLINARFNHEAQRLELATPIKPMQEFNCKAPLKEEVNHSFGELLKKLCTQQDALINKITEQREHLTKLQKNLEGYFKKEMLSTAQQLEAFLGVQNFFNHGEYVPAMHGWPVSPDFALYLIELIERKEYDIIIEFGSGTSTVLIAKTLAKLADRRLNKAPTVQISFEHLEQYYEKTHLLLRQAKLENQVHLVLAPLSNYISRKGIHYSYYSCNAALAEASKQTARKTNKILVVVDGPPAKTGKHARYPAVPMLIKNFSGAVIDVLLDDYIRDDEKEIARMWVEDIEELGLDWKMTEKKMEKDSCLITIEPRASMDAKNQ